MTLQKKKGAVRRFARLLKFAAWLQALPRRTTPAPFQLLQMGSAFWQSRALYVAARLDLAGALGDEALPVDTLALRCAVTADPLQRLLRLLAALGVFEETTPGHFRNSAVSHFLRKEHPQSMRAMVLMHNSPEMSLPWLESLEQGIRTGQPPFALQFGQELFDYMDKHPEFDRLFSQAMDSVEALTGDSFATDFDWGRFRRVIDVGGSAGSKSRAIMRRHPGLRALVQDRPAIIAKVLAAQQNTAQDETSVRMSFVGGDALSEVPAAEDAGDIYLLSALLHGFDDVQCVRILHAVRRAIGDTGATVVILEVVMPESGADLNTASFDMQMFIGTRGRERTLAQWQALLERSGLSLQEQVHLRSFAKMLVCTPQPQGVAAISSTT
jgi:hypothetical protein